ncbi:hypothetical protein CDIK_4489 [Cucumispora dikerogammari]|nr:hypothetical protein CDIK_4489 [Cucumispora dikerogammari]
MQFDIGHGDHERFIIFFTNFKSCFFRTTKTLLIDATFRITSQGFYQVLILHGTFLDKAYSTVYVLIANKIEALYLKVLSKIPDLTTIKSNIVLLNFKKALINAVSKIYLEAEVNLCFFHFSQAI